MFFVKDFGALRFALRAQQRCAFGLQRRTALLRFLYLDPLDGFVAGIVFKLHFNQIPGFTIGQGAINVVKLSFTPVQVSKSRPGLF